MRYNKIVKFEISNGKGIGMSLFTQGCHFHCEGCFNPETWDFSKGEKWTAEVEEHFMKLVGRPYISRITFVGGEPLIFSNLPDLLKLVRRIKEQYPNKKIWVYSGFTYENMWQMQKEVLQYADVLVDGQFDINKRDITLAFRGSSNQRVIDLQKTREKGEVVLYE